VYNKFGTIVAIVLAIFPFAAVLAKLSETEGATTVLVVAAIIVLFFATLLVATRITIEPDTTSAPAARAPAPPIAWSWDGVNRQPGNDNGEEHVEAQH